MKKNDLAFFGGRKAITYKSPHWNWPPKSQKKIKAINDYYENENIDQAYYPKVVQEFEKNLCIQVCMFLIMFHKLRTLSYLSQKQTT